MGNFKNKIKMNDIGKHCQLLIDDFFAFTEGRADDVKHIVISDISDPIPPSVEQMQKMFARCKQAWIGYCQYLNLPRECRQLFTNKTKKEWLRREEEQQQKKIPVRKRNRSASN